MTAQLYLLNGPTKNSAASLERVEEGRKQEEIECKLYSALKKIKFKNPFALDNAGMDFFYISKRKHKCKLSEDENVLN